jgi:uncharacterized membrane protein (DUF373 family)
MKHVIMNLKYFTLSLKSFNHMVDCIFVILIFVNLHAN